MLCTLFFIFFQLTGCLGEISVSGWAWWLKPVIPDLWEAKASDHLRSGVPDQPGQLGETLCLPKIQKLARIRWCVSVVPATQEAEAQESLKSRRKRLQ